MREYQQQPEFSAQDAAQLSEMRYRGGAASYLEVLTNETNYGLAQAQSNELGCTGDLVRGWVAEPVTVGRERCA
jgi:outer membrane protein TolC